MEKLLYIIERANFEFVEIKKKKKVLNTET